MPATFAIGVVWAAEASPAELQALADFLPLSVNPRLLWDEVDAAVGTGMAHLCCVVFNCGVHHVSAVRRGALWTLWDDAHPTIIGNTPMMCQWAIAGRQRPQMLVYGPAPHPPPSAPAAGRDAPAGQKPAAFRGLPPLRDVADIPAPPIPTRW